MCVLTAAVGRPSSNRSAKEFQLVGSAPDMHVWSEKHTCVCPQQQLVGQPLTLGCNPQWTASATHMCVCAHSSNWSAKVVECSEPSLGLLIELFCKTHVCVGSNNLSAYPQLTSCATHVCVCSQQQPSRSAKVFQNCPSFN